jgi:hypothetical protein
MVKRICTNITKSNGQNPNGEIKINEMGVVKSNFEGYLGVPPLQFIWFKKSQFRSNGVAFFAVSFFSLRKLRDQKRMPLQPLTQSRYLNRICKKAKPFLCIYDLDFKLL